MTYNQDEDVSILYKLFLFNKKTEKRVKFTDIQQERPLTTLKTFCAHKFFLSDEEIKAQKIFATHV